MGRYLGCLLQDGSVFGHEEGARPSTGPQEGSALPCPAPVHGSPPAPARGSLPAPARVGPGWEVPSSFSVPQGGRTQAPSWQMFIPSGPELPLMVHQCFLRHHCPRCQKYFSHVQAEFSCLNGKAEHAAFPSPDREAGWIFSVCSYSLRRVSSGPEKSELRLFHAS